MKNIYKEGDWVWWEYGAIRQIKSLNPFSWKDDEDEGTNLLNCPEEYRLATNKEIIKAGGTPNKIELNYDIY